MWSTLNAQSRAEQSRRDCRAAERRNPARSALPCAFAPAPRAKPSWTPSAPSADSADRTGSRASGKRRGSAGEAKFSLVSYCCIR